MMPRLRPTPTDPAHPPTARQPLTTPADDSADNRPTENNRVLSGMRPTGRLHLGHYHGVLKNWVRLQGEYDCFYFVADWHALTTHYERPDTMRAHVWEMVIDWLAAGVDPEKATLFIQSHVPEHAELHLLLSMITPLGWLERVPSFKEQQQKLHAVDLSTYGFLGYPLLQSADILMYRAAFVPVGKDQVPHVELTREIARRFNHVFGRGKDVGRDERNVLGGYRKGHDERNVLGGYRKGRDVRNVLQGYRERRGRSIFPEPQVLLTEAAKMPGLDGQKMSKSYDNIIALRDDPKRVERAIASMPTDPARVRLTDPGDPDKCPVWQLHQVYSDEEVRDWASAGCRAASFGCLECKRPLIDAVLEEQRAFHERARRYESQPGEVRGMIEAGNDNARRAARKTMEVVRAAVGAVYADSP